MIEDEVIKGWFVQRIDEKGFERDQLESLIFVLKFDMTETGISLMSKKTKSKWLWLELPVWWQS